MPFSKKDYKFNIGLFKIVFRDLIWTDTVHIFFLAVVWWQINLFGKFLPVCSVPVHSVLFPGNHTVMGCNLKVCLRCSLWSSLTINKFLCHSCLHHNHWSFNSMCATGFIVCHVYFVCQVQCTPYKNGKCDLKYWGKIHCNPVFQYTNITYCIRLY